MIGFEKKNKIRKKKGLEKSRISILLIEALLKTPTRRT